MTHSEVVTETTAPGGRLAPFARANVWGVERCGATFRDTAPFTDVAYADVGKW